MKAILYVVALVVALGAGYFTLEHSRKFGELEVVRLKTIADNKAIAANADVKENELKKEKDGLSAAQQQSEELTQGIEALKSSGTALERDVAELDSTLQTQEEEFTQLNKTLDEVATIVKGLGEDVTLDNLAEKIQQIEDDREARKTELEDLETNAGTAEKVLTANRAEVDRLVKREIDRNARIGRNAMEAVVTAVNQDWGFLVIGGGSNSGFTPQTSLLVERDGRMIGRVTPSAIEPTQTIAEIDFDSVSSGVRIQPGDRVILTKPTAN